MYQYSVCFWFRGFSVDSTDLSELLFIVTELRDMRMMLSVCVAGTMGRSLAAPSIRKWALIWRRRWIWPGPPGITAHASASPPNTCWTPAPPLVWVWLRYTSQYDGRDPQLSHCIYECNPAVLCWYLPFCNFNNHSYVS